MKTGARALGLGGKGAAKAVQVGKFMKTAKVTGAVKKARSIRRLKRAGVGLAKTGADIGAYTGTRAGLEKAFPGRRRPPTQNAWTEEARRKSAETRRLNALMKSRSGKHPHMQAPQEQDSDIKDLAARGLGFALGGGLIIEGRAGAKALAQKIQKEGLPKKTAQKVAKSFIDPKGIRKGADQFAKRSPGMGRRVIEILKKLKKPAAQAAYKLAPLVT